MKRRLVATAALLVLAAGCAANEPAPEIPSDTAANDSAPIEASEQNPTQPADQAPVDPVRPTDAPGTTGTPTVDGAPDEVRDTAFEDLETLRKNAEAILDANPNFTDTQLRDAVLRDAKLRSTLSAEGSTGITVTFTAGESSCSGVIVFEGGSGTWKGTGCS